MIYVMWGLGVFYVIASVILGCDAIEHGRDIHNRPFRSSLHAFAYGWRVSFIYVFVGIYTVLSAFILIFTPNLTEDEGE